MRYLLIVNSSASRYLLSTAGAFIFTLASVYSLEIAGVSIALNFFITQTMKAFTFFFITKYFVFKDKEDNIGYQLKFYIFIIIFFKVIEYLGLLLINSFDINHFLNILIILTISSFLKFFSFKYLFNKKDFNRRFS